MEAKLMWEDVQDIVFALMDKYPDEDPLKLDFPKLQKMVTELELFKDDPNGSDEEVLEAIQMTWHEMIE